jgi:hypothetical protein
MSELRRRNEFNLDREPEVKPDLIQEGGKIIQESFLPARPPCPDELFVELEDDIAHASSHDGALIFGKCCYPSEEPHCGAQGLFKKHRSVVMSLIHCVLFYKK